MNSFTQPEGLAPGIYFGLPEEKYHSDPALSRGGIVHLLKSWRDYWESSCLNPERKKKKVTDALIFGTRSHEFLMDQKTFFKKYSVTGSGWERGKVLIPRNEFDEIKESVEEIQRVKEAYAYFQNGFPEVTIIVTCRETGIRLRIRIDYMRTFGAIDYKRMKSLDDSAIGYATYEHGYDIQQELYQQVMREAKLQLRKGKIKVYGVHDPNWMKEFVKDDACLFRFVLQRSISPYIFEIRNLDAEILQNSRVHIMDAKQRYLEGIKHYGTERPPAGTGETKELSIYHMPKRFIDRGARPA